MHPQCDGGEDELGCEDSGQGWDRYEDKAGLWGPGSRTGARGHLLQSLIQVSNLAVSCDGHCPSDHFWDRAICLPGHQGIQKYRCPETKENNEEMSRMGK